MTSHNHIPQAKNRIADPIVAYDVASAEKPYRELELHAKQLGLGRVSIDLAQQAIVAGDIAYVSSSKSDRASGAYRLSGEGSPEPEHIGTFNVLTRSFETARQKMKKQFSDAFIDNALDGNLTVAGEKAYFIKSYFDLVPMTKKDREIANNPARIAATYRETSEMMLRNLKLFRTENTKPERIAEIKHAQQTYKSGLDKQIPVAEQQLIHWCQDYKNNEYPLDATEYKGFRLDGKDLLNIDVKSPLDVETNFKIQRQIAGTFIMAYSDRRVIERKMQNRTEAPNRRIYLNPDIEATPRVFEAVLKMANEQGISLQLKMLQHANELAPKYQELKNQPERVGGLRGDSIVIYVNSKYEDHVLERVLDIVEENAAAFHDRGVSRMPAKIADGVAIGDEPVGVGGRESLTSHRSELIEEALNRTRLSGLTGVRRRDFFRQTFRRLAEQRHVNPDNFSFNS